MSPIVYITEIEKLHANGVLEAVQSKNLFSRPVCRDINRWVGSRLKTSGRLKKTIAVQD